jgi:hypothetical protein
VRPEAREGSRPSLRGSVGWGCFFGYRYIDRTRRQLGAVSDVDEPPTEPRRMRGGRVRALPAR